MMYKTEWLCELRSCSHKMNLIDNLTASPHCCYRKHIETESENSTSDISVNLLGFKGLNTLMNLCMILSE